MWMIDNMIPLCIAIFIVGFFASVVYYFRDKRMTRAIKDFDSYTAILQYHLDRAYEIIHKDRVLIYSLEASRVPEEQINIASKDYVKLVEKLLGPRLCKEFIFLYGDVDTFVFNIVEYFSTRYEGDEIRKSAVDEMMEAETPEAPEI